MVEKRGAGRDLVFGGEGGHVISTDKNLFGGEYLDLERPAMLVTCNKHVL